LVGVLVPGALCLVDPTQAVVRVVVTDPSGIASVTLDYQRAGDPSVQSVPMSLVSGWYRVTLDTGVGTGWAPVNSPYVIQLGVSATDKAGNVSTRALQPAFTVEFCQ
jgi:hypothetical protein